MADNSNSNDIYAQYRSIIMLAALLTSINNMPEASSRLARPQDLAHLRSDQKIVDPLIKSYSDLITQNSEVLAVTHGDSQTGSDPQMVIAILVNPDLNDPEEYKSGDSGQYKLIMDSNVSHLSHVDSWHYILNLQ